MADPRSELIEAVARVLHVSALDETEVDAVLSLAGAAAHGTADRTAAPLTCYLAGLAASDADRAQVLARVHAFVEARTVTT